LIVSINFARSIVNRQAAAPESEPLVVAAGIVLMAVAATILVAVAGAEVADAEVAVTAIVEVAVPPMVTSITTHKRESSPTLMIKPAGFLMTKLA
jgi:hypothetical protein